MKKLIYLLFVFVMGLGLQTPVAYAGPLTRLKQFLGMGDEVTEIRKLKTNRPQLAKGDVWPGQKRAEGPDIFHTNGSGEIFSSLDEVDIVRTVGQEKALLDVAGEFDNPTSLGAVIVGEKGVGKSQIAKAQEFSFRKQAILNPDEKKNFVVKVDTQDLDFRNADKFTESTKALKAELEKALAAGEKAGDLANVGKIVFYIDDLSPFKDTQLFDVYINALNKVKPGKVKFMLETDETLYKAIVSKSSFKKKFNKVPVKESTRVAENLSIVMTHFKVIDPKILEKVDHKAVSDLIRWVKQYVPEDGVADTAIHLLGKALGKQQAFLKDDVFKMSDEVIDELADSLSKLKDELSQVSQYSGSYADELKASIPRLIEKTEKELSEAQNTYDRLVKIRRIMHKTQSEYYETGVSQARKKELASLYAKLEAEALQINDRRLAYEVVEYAKNVHQRNIKMSNVLRYSGRMTLDEFETLLNRTIYGQEDLKASLMKAAAKILRRYADPQRYDHIKEPVYSGFFWGPPGTGKTEGFSLLRKLTDGYYQVRGAEFQTSADINRLKGAPAGYVGYEEGGEIVGIMSSKPQTAVLFDEVEVMHNSVYQWIAQFYDPGVISDGLNRTARTNQSVMGLTSNAIEHAPAHLDVHNRDDVIRALLDANPTFEPKLFSRMEDIVYVPKPDRHTSLQIMDKFLSLANESPGLTDAVVRVRFSKNAQKALLDFVEESTEGSARNMRSAVNQFSENAVNDLIEQGYWKGLDGKSHRALDSKGNKITNMNELFGKELELVHHTEEGFALRVLE